MERNNIKSIYYSAIELVQSGAEVRIIKKAHGENKIIIFHKDTQILLDYFDYVLQNYTNTIVTEIKLKSRNKIVLYVNV